MLGPWMTLWLTVACWKWSDAASFYGDSYVHLPFTNSIKDVHLKLRFLSWRPDGLLFLAKDENDYFYVYLKDGFVSLKCNFGSGPLTWTFEEVGNNGKWHHVDIRQNDQNITINVDGVIETLTLPGNLLLLNKNDIFLGGVPKGHTFKEKLSFFRGCLGNVEFNQYDILQNVQRLPVTSGNVHHVTYTCSPEFTLQSSTPIHFKSNLSFAAFHHLPFKDRGSLSFQFKSHSENGLLFFNLARKTNKDLIAVEIISKKLRLTANKGGKDVTVDSTTVVSDGRWHRIFLGYRASQISLVVDSSRQLGQFDQSSNRQFDFSGHFFFGGLTSHVRKHAIEKNIESVVKLGSSGHFIGCVKDISINSNLIGFQEIQLSHDLDSGCRCASDASSSCEGMISSEQSKTNSQNTSSSGSVQLIQVNPVKLQEGQEQTVSTDNIHVLFNYKEIGIRESAIQFRIIKFPKYGYISIDLGRRRNKDVFTLLDLEGRKVSYVHDGSETTSDEAVIKITIASDDFAELQQLTHTYDFVLPFTIQSVDDVSVLNFLNVTGNEASISMAKNTKLRLTKSIINITDPDTHPGNISVKVSCKPKKPKEESGRFEKSDNPDVSVDTFNYQELLDGQIWFASRSWSSVCTLTVAGFSKVLTINAITVRVSLIKNTGINVPRSSFSLITASNFTSVTDIPFQDVEIRYTIVNEPQYGEIQRKQYSNGSWVKVDTFAQRHINNNLIRYVHKDVSRWDNYDQFSYTTSCLDQIRRKQTFYIHLKEVVISMINPPSLKLVHKDKEIISTDHLKATTNDPHMHPKNIIFRLSRPPIFGNIYRIHHLSLSDDSVLPLKLNDFFTQEDVDQGFIQYKLKRTIHKKLKDFLDFQVLANPARPKAIRLHVEYIPKEASVRLTNSVLDSVTEGGYRVITKNYLFLETDEYSDFEFDIVDFPQSGTLEIVDPRNALVLKRNVTKFTTMEINAHRLVYRHDDSESSKDSFAFIASPILTKTSTFPAKVQEYNGVFEIQITMRNDNPPTRVVDKVFNVVTNSEKLITLNDVKFADPDINFDPMNLKYKRTKISNGRIISSIHNREIFEFTQLDLAQGKVLFRHSGREYGRAIMMVDDGQYVTKFTLEIRAESPYIKIQNNTGIYAKVGNYSDITTYNLSVESNINRGVEDVEFRVIEKPLYGDIIVNDRPISKFTLRDLMNGVVKYKHKHGKSGQDFFRFSVFVDNVQDQGKFSIRIGTDQIRHLPHVVNNEILKVVSGSRTVIGRNNLLVSHSDSPPSSLVYTITGRPKYGRIYVFQGSKVQDGNVFTQADIDAGHVTYQHLQEQTLMDFFIFDVSNGIPNKKLRGLKFAFQIVPSVLDIDVKNFTIREGGRRPITSSDISVKIKTGEKQDITFYITQQPKHGSIEQVGDRGKALSSFTMENINQGRVYYVHDGSDSVTDDFILKGALTGEKQESREKHVYVEIEAVNDEAPELVINKGLSLWQKSLALITKDILYSRDPDSPPEGIIYVVTKPTNGRLALLNNTFKDISTFTQRDINNRLVVFVHGEGNSGNFYFYVTDGVNGNRARQEFTISAQQLVLSVITNSPLLVYPSRTQVISRSHLFSSTNNPNQTKPIMYHLQTQPTKGQLVKKVKQRTALISSFSQEEINRGEIFYEHQTSTQSWNDSDSFVFELQTLYAKKIENEVFHIRISYGFFQDKTFNDFIHVEGFTVIRGGEKNLSQHHLDVTNYTRHLQNSGKQVSVVYTLMKPPKHGQLAMKRGPILMNGSNFTQENINSRMIRYVHDNTNFNEDSFDVSILILVRSAGSEEEIHNIQRSVNISIINGKDESFRFLPQNPTIEVSGGDSAIVNDNILKTVNKYTPANRIWYEIVSEARNGIVGYRENPRQKIKKFTQEDINNRRVIFTQIGDAISSEFQVKISDEHFTHLRKVVKVKIVSFMFEVKTNTTIEILQSFTSANISNLNLDMQTNGRRDKVIYKITKTPKYGQVFLNMSPVRQFTQMDVNDGKVLYIQRDMSSPTDMFQCDIIYQGSNREIRDRSVFISVKPLIKQSPVKVSIGNRTAITVANLDASKLAKITGSIPKYKIVEHPKYGKIVKNMAENFRSRREINYRNQYMEATQFTHRDIRSGSIFYEITSSHIPVTENQDSFKYLLSARGVQPAFGVMTFDLQGLDEGAIDDSAKSDEVVSPSISHDFVLILAILIPLFILVVLVIVIVYFLWRRHRYRNYAPPTEGHKVWLRPEISGPIPLDQPHVHMEHHEAEEDDHSLLYEHHNYYNVPVTSISKDSLVTSQQIDSVMALPSNCTEVSATIPECKVTPLPELNTRDSIVSTKSSVDLFDWSIIDDPELMQYCRTTTPVLRKSQYWV